MKIELTRDQALDAACKLANETLKLTWVVRVIAGERHSYQNVPGYEVRTEQPRDNEDIYREVMPAPRNDSVDNVTLIMVNSGWGIDIKAYFTTEELAQQYAAKFPKSLKMRAYRVNGYDHSGNSIDFGGVGVHIKLCSDDVNKGVNETGVARLRRIQKLAPHVMFGSETQRARISRVQGGAS